MPPQPNPAECPLCRRTAPTVRIKGLLVFARHTTTGGAPCPGKGSAVPTRSSRRARAAAQARSASLAQAKAAAKAKKPAKKPRLTPAERAVIATTEAAERADRESRLRAEGLDPAVRVVLGGHFEGNRRRH